MQTTTDWISLWQDLVAINNRRHNQSFHKHQRAPEFDHSVRVRWQKPDSSLEFFLKNLKPESTILDICAGTGAWSILAAPLVCHVTAVEPDLEMTRVLRENLSNNRIDNVSIIEDFWPAAAVEPHDITLCAHSMYGVHDIVSFIKKMEQVTRETIFLLVRQPTLDGAMAEAAQIIWGHPYDSPNFAILYNILLQMGIYPNVLMEDSGLWKPWRNDSIAGALKEMKNRLGLNGPEYDQVLMEVLERRLTHDNGTVVWPSSIRSALIYWKPGSDNKAW